MLSTLRTTFFLSLSVAVFAQNTHPLPSVQLWISERFRVRRSLPTRWRVAVTGEAQAVQGVPPTTDRRNLPAEHGARPVQRTRASPTT